MEIQEVLYTAVMQNEILDAECPNYEDARYYAQELYFDFCSDNKCYLPETIQVISFVYDEEHELIILAIKDEELRYEESDYGTS